MQLSYLKNKARYAFGGSAVDRKPLGNLFLSVGAMKAGTTWLYSVLSRHPSLCFSHEKEIHFFYHQHVRNDMLSSDRRYANVVGRYLPQMIRDSGSASALADNLSWCSRYLAEPSGYEWFKSIFPRQGKDDYLCDFSNLTAHIPAAGWQSIARDTHKLRVIYVLRDPVKRLWSHVKFHLKFSGQLDDLKEWSLHDIEIFTRQQFIWSNAEYGAAIARMKAGLPAECFRIVFYEDIHSDQRRFLTDIEDFLGISHQKYSDAVLNQRPTEGPRYPEPLGFRSLFEKDVSRICNEMRAQGVDPHPKWS